MSRRKKQVHTVAAHPRSEYGIVRNPQDWLVDPKIIQAADLVGWDKLAPGNFALLGAIMAIESHGDTLAKSPAPDNCVGLTQYNPKNTNGLNRNFRTEVNNAFEKTGASRPGTDISGWYNDPRTAIIYSGFIFQENMQRAKGGNLLLALQGYNGGNDDLRAPAAVNKEARKYPEIVGAYLHYQAKNGVTQAIRDSNQAMFDRLQSDADALGQGDRIRLGVRRYEPSFARNEKKYAETHPKVSQPGRWFEGTIDKPSSYLTWLHNARDNGVLGYFAVEKTKGQPVNQASANAVPDAPKVPPVVSTGRDDHVNILAKVHAVADRFAPNGAGKRNADYAFRSNATIGPAVLEALKKQDYYKGETDSFVANNAARKAERAWEKAHAGIAGVEQDGLLNAKEIALILAPGTTPPVPNGKSSRGKV